MNGARALRADRYLLSRECRHARRHVYAIFNTQTSSGQTTAPAGQRVVIVTALVEGDICKRNVISAILSI